MIPKSLSASSVIKAQACLAMWVANYYHKASEPGGSAANLGTACHGGLEDWVTDGHSHDPTATFETLEKLFAKYYHALFSDTSRYDEGVKIMKNWYDREHPLKNTVLSTEVKENFPLRIKGENGGTIVIPFNYIWDRCDALTEERCTECGNCPLEIDVVDYKSVMMPVSPDALKDKIQARAYGVAAQIKYPHANRIWVTFDLLRYEAPVSIVYTRDQNIAAYKYILTMLQRILNTDEDAAPETINAECKWCIRASTCKTLHSNISVGGYHSMTANEAVKARAEIDNKVKGLKGAKEQLDSIIMAYADNEDVFEWDVDNIKVQITAYGQRTIDPERAAKVIGVDLMGRYGKLTIGNVDKMIKAKEVDKEQAKELRALIRKQYGDPYVKTSEKNPIDT